ncbi:MAG: CPXCG motif-containing cysteine-rich protein [Planctomycetaceae bacterium]|nr:CPXCG motif-containing cysteine-rich protein [Planctomycetaceae bacterium]
MDYEANCICDSCGEEIVIPIGPSAGRSQEYVEDCPVCCHPNVIRVGFESDGDFQLYSEAE